MVSVGGDRIRQARRRDAAEVSEGGSGQTALVLLHTVRTQLDHFQLVIPKILHAFTVYAIDMPGMGWLCARTLNHSA